MSECVVIGKDFFNKELSIKEESCCEDEKDVGYEIFTTETKCGDIFHSANGLFVFCCYYCSERFATIKEFVSHFNKKHTTIFIATETDETQFNLAEVKEIEEVEETNELSTDLLNGNGAIVQKAAKVYSETEVQSPKCLSTFRSKNHLINRLGRIHKDDSKSPRKHAVRNAGDDIESEIRIKVQGNVDESEEDIEMINLNVGSCEFEENIFKREEDGEETCIDPLQISERNENFPGKAEDSVDIQQTSIPETPFKCRICFKQFAKSSFLISHEKIHGEKSYKCVDCSKLFYQKNSLHRHLRNEHGAVSNSKAYQTRIRNSLSLDCRFCDKHFNTIEEREAHESTHSVGDQYQCHTCAKIYKSKHRMMLHKLFHTGEKPFKCSECPQAFFAKDNLTVHQRRKHFNERNFKCDHCEKSFVTSTERKSHMRLHDNVRPFQCAECGKKFTTSGALRIHQLRHTQTKRHTCEVCQKSFYNTVELRIHKIVHQKKKKRLKKPKGNKDNEEK